MATNIHTNENFRFDFGLARLAQHSTWAYIAVPIGRLLYAFVFLLSSLGHFQQSTIDYAASHGVPLAIFLVPFSGLMILFGGLSIGLGYKARLGALLIILFLVPVTLIMHDFWNLSDPMQMMLQRAMFMKNTSMLGAALLIFYFGSGPLSLDRRKAK